MNRAPIPLSTVEPSQQAHSHSAPRRFLAGSACALMAWAAAFSDVGAQSAVAKPPPPVPAMEVPFEVFTDYKAGNALAERLRTAPPKFYNFDRASLRDVLRFLADDAGIPFVALQESSTVESTLITFTLRASPFLALETIARANGVMLFFESGVWFMRPINEKELVGRIYKLKYNAQQNVVYQGGGSQSGATTGVTTPTTGSGIPDLNINIQGSANVFEIKTPEIIDQIKSLLGIPTAGTKALLAAEATVDSLTPIEAPGGINPAGSMLEAAEGTAKGDSGAQIVYNADANTAYVIATRQQHQWVEGYLTAVDRPQALIGIEVKFFETTRDPSKELGVNWAGTLKGGYSVTASGEATFEGGINSETITRTMAQTLDGTLGFSGERTVDGTTSTFSSSTSGRGNGSTVNVDAESGTISLSDPTYRRESERTTGFTGGYSAVLSPDAVSVALQAFISDQDTTTVQYPRVLTINNREVVIRSVRNQPVLASTSSVTPGVGGTTTASVSYLPIGTIINVLPKTMPDNSVVLNAAITVSSIISFEPIQGNLYPVASSRVYNAALQVDSGYTLAVGGIEEAYDVREKNGVPFLKDIPGVGELFRSKALSRKKRNLIIFITPTVIHDRTDSPGISEKPASVLPVRPGQPTPPAFTTGGRLVGGEQAIDEALAWLQFQIEYFRQINKEAMADVASVKQLRSVISTAQMLVEEIQRMEEELPGSLPTLVKKEEAALEALKELNTVLSRSKKVEMDFFER